MAVKCLNDQELEARIGHSTGYMVVAFLDWASEPCKNFRVEFEALAELVTGADFFWIEALENESVAEYYEVLAVPTTLLFREGTKIGCWEGPYSRESLKDRLVKAIASGKSG